VKNAARLAMLYAFFAALATASNLGSQAVVIWAYQGNFAVEISILVGTGIGLPIKYLLDKRYIFRFATKDLAHDSWLFILFTLMGVATTLLFWGTEYAFHLLFDTATMRYLGGAIGLILGYIIKYQLDKRYVFVSKTAMLGNAA